MPQKYMVVMGTSGYLPDYQSELMDDFQDARELLVNLVEDEKE